jgi:RHS repeat-associated protein
MNRSLAHAEKPKKQILTSNVYRHGDYFWQPVSVNNATGAVWLVVTNRALSNGVPLTTVTGNVFFARTAETFGYDLDGNLTNDGRWNYTWDAENRLVGMVSRTDTPSGSRRSLSFGYDWQWRRISKVVSNWTGSAWSKASEQRFVYDGWNLIAILAPDLSPLTSFCWGTDASGTMQGAGGVGGLISMTVHTGTNAGTYLYAYDGNFNVVGLVNASNGVTAAQYEYGPFGELLRATGPMAKENHLRFSTKYQDDESDLVYYGYRFYSPSTGSWLSPDPMGEQGGMNLYGFVINDPINYFDDCGFKPKGGLLSGMRDWLGGYVDDYHFVHDFFHNTGSTNRFYTDGDRLVEYLKTSNGIRLGLNRYKAKGCPSRLDDIYFDTILGYLYGLAGGYMNPAEFQVGGFAGMTITRNNEKTVHIHFVNRASYRSLLGQGVLSAGWNRGVQVLQGSVDTGIGTVNGLLPSSVPPLQGVTLPRWQQWPEYQRGDGSGRPATIYQTFDFTMPNPCCK